MGRPFSVPPIDVLANTRLVRAEKANPLAFDSQPTPLFGHDPLGGKPGARLAKVAPPVEPAKPSEVPATTIPGLFGFKVGDRAPALDMKDSEGKPFSLEAYKGQVVVVDFWGTYCSSCTEEMPALKALYEANKSKGLAMVGIATGDDDDTLNSFKQNLGLRWPQLADPQSEIHERFHVSQNPFKVLIDRNGIIRGIYDGDENESLQKGIAALLAGRSIAVRRFAPPSPTLSREQREAFLLEHKYRVPPTPIPDSETPRTRILTPADPFTPADLMKDFKANKQPGQKLIAVIVKTELCCDNGFRGCAVTSAVFEKTHPELKVYSAWIKRPWVKFKDAAEEAATNLWYQRVAETYDFEQDPGATIVFIDPETGRRVRTDAAEMELSSDAYDKSGGRTDVLDQKIAATLAAFAAKNYDDIPATYEITWASDLRKLPRADREALVAAGFICTFKDNQVSVTFASKRQADAFAAIPPEDRVQHLEALIQRKCLDTWMKEPQVSKARTWLRNPQSLLTQPTDKIAFFNRRPEIEYQTPFRRGLGDRLPVLEHPELKRTVAYRAATHVRENTYHWGEASFREYELAFGEVATVGREVRAFLKRIDEHPEVFVALLRRARNADHANAILNFLAVTSAFAVANELVGTDDTGARAFERVRIALAGDAGKSLRPDVRDRLRAYSVEPIFVNAPNPLGRQADNERLVAGWRYPQDPAKGRVEAWKRRMQKD